LIIVSPAGKLPLIFIAGKIVLFDVTRVVSGMISLAGFLPPQPAAINASLKLREFIVVFS
jgi:hypothetical protein